MLRTTLTLASLALSACQTVPASPGLSERQVTTLRANGFHQSGDEWTLGIPDRLLFKIDESGLIPEQIERLRGLSGQLMQVSIHGARVEGHTDSTGSAEYNRQLSLRRAEAVKQALVQGGMDAASVRTAGLGKSSPIESNRTAAGRRENRRVAIIVTAADMAGTDPAGTGAAGTGATGTGTR